MSEETTIVKLNGKDYLLKNLTDIRAVPCNFGGEECLWFRPSSDFPVWTAETIVFRSLIVRKEDGKIVSAGFKKFFNGEEKAHIHPAPKDIKEITFVDKLDGSLLIVAKHNGELITRTRNALTKQHSNAKEVNDLGEKYPKLYDNDFINSGHYSLLLEWTTPTNIIVINYGKTPDVRLLNVVDHRDYSLLPLRKVREIAEHLGLKTPREIKVESFEALQTMLKDPNYREEGVCGYFDKDQNIRKFKGDWYLTTHRAKSDISFSRILDIFIVAEMPVETFEATLEQSFDHECMAEVQPHMEHVLSLYANVLAKEKECTDFVAKLTKDYPSYSRHQKYQEVINKFQGHYASICMKLLDNKKVSPKEYRTLIDEERKSSK